MKSMATVTMRDLVFISCDDKERSAIATVIRMLKKKGYIADNR
jgi:hypothetical protein